MCWLPCSRMKVLVISICQAGATEWPVIQCSSHAPCLPRRLSWDPVGFCSLFQVQLFALPNSLQCHQLVHMPCAVLQSYKVVIFTFYPVALAALQIWQGYNQSVRPCQSGPTLNVDITFGAFVTAQPLTSLVAHAAGFANQDDLKRRALDKTQVYMVNKQIRGIQVGGS